MAIPVQPLPTIGSPNSSEDPKIRSALSELQTVLTGGTDVTNLSTATLQFLGLTNGAQVGRGKSIIAADGTRSNVAFGAVSNGPDVVTNVVVPVDAILVVGFEAIWAQTGAGDATAAIFIGANQLKTGASAGGVPTVQQVAQTGSTNDGWLHTTSIGLVAQSQAGPAVTGVTTGQVIAHEGTGGGGGPSNIAAGGGLTFISVANGTYDVSVQFKNTANIVHVKNRKLWVWTIGF